MDTILKLENISKLFGGNYVLRDVSLEFTRGEIHSVIGENGAGKSTLMKILGGIYRPNGGKIYKDGKHIEIHNPVEAYAHKIGIVHQELSVSGNLSVAENIFAGCQPTNHAGFINEKKMKAMAKELLTGMGVNIDPAGIVEQLSVAMQQVVEIAKVVSRNIDILILDEPTSSLSIKETEHLFELMRRMCAEKNLTVIFISHKLDEIIEISDRVSVLRNGVLVGTISGADITSANMINMMVGRELAKEDFYAPSVPPGEVVFSAQHLSRSPRFQDISFDLRRCEIVGLFGLIGAGRTEMIQSIIGADALDEGEIYYFGKKVLFRSPRQAIAGGISYLTENRRDLGLFMSKPLYDNVVASTLSQFTTKLGTIDRKKCLSTSEAYVKNLDIHPSDIRKHAINFSGGNQQKILFAKTLENNPKILIVDEPTRGVDVGVKVTIRQMIRDLADQGMAVLMISSELPEILKLSDRVMVMHEGRLKGILENHDLKESDIIEVAYRKEASHESSHCAAEKPGQKG